MSEETRIILVNNVSLSEYITITNDFRKLEEKIERLNKKLENLEKLNNANYQSFIETNNIINKVIESVQEHYDNSYSTDDVNDIGSGTYDDLMKILKGVDKE